MSVIHFSDEEFAGLWHRLGGDPELQYPLHCLAIANRAAYMLTYAPRHEDACTIEVPAFEQPIADTRDSWTATDRVNLHDGDGGSKRHDRSGTRWLRSVSQRDGSPLGGTRRVSPLWLVPGRRRAE